MPKRQAAIKARQKLTAGAKAAFEEEPFDADPTPALRSKGQKRKIKQESDDEVETAPSAKRTRKSKKGAVEEIVAPTYPGFEAWKTSTKLTVDGKLSDASRVSLLRAYPIIV